MTESVSTPLVLTGASGWFGRTALFEYEKQYGPQALRNDVIACASTNKAIDFESPYGPIEAIPLEDLAQIKSAGGLLHLAFLTREHVASLGTEEYIQQNRSITSSVRSWIEDNPGMPIITTSSGAAAALEVKQQSLHDNPYAVLKNEEEEIWAALSQDRLAVVLRVFAASGRFMKDPGLFALGDFIVKAKAGHQVVIRSPRMVVRSYVHVGTMMRLCWAMLRSPREKGFRKVDACTHTYSLVELAQMVSDLWGLGSPLSNLDPDLPPDSYSADPQIFLNMLKVYRIKPPTMQAQIRETSLSF